MKLAIIDLGTNSIRFDIYEIQSRDSFERILRRKRMVRLGDGLFQSGRLKQEAMLRVIRALESYRRRILALKVDRVVAFATAAVRDASNGARFIDLVRRRTGISLEVISGQREAELIAKGILKREALPDSVFALVDIGGGSTEVSLCRGGTLLDSCSLRLGAARLQQLYLKTSPPGPGARGVEPVAALRAHVHAEVARVVAARRWPVVDTIVGSSGTIRAFRKLIRATGGRDQPFKRKALASVLDRITPMTQAQLLRLEGMEPRRADLILAGGLLLDELMATLGAKRAYTTNLTLRDGILELELEKPLFVRR